jgi:hypothetical protein
MGKLIWMAAVFVFGCRMLTGRWPWEMWRIVAVEPAP